VERTHYLLLCKDDGEVVEQYDIGGEDNWNLNKSFAKSVLMNEITADVERTTEPSE